MIARIFFYHILIQSPLNPHHPSLHTVHPGEIF